ncbi:beta-ketoacyl-ACP synthase III [Clostridium sp. JN-9]|uniref:beta-ketoacyl-ACP synthase III n=1 Tax=Clostridium sp. JN-9 TaxID=2507159 RepID=UPI000FFE1866|nr:beta-ketoacyl-ACP synthase III [Clostridium sp. JN-9]QAT41515.1 ketoacyl-ACP synthase III [Clostridium sp. JN-9]
MNKVQIIGTGSYVPENVVTNEDLSKMVDTTDEWIATRTGIRERRISTGENTSQISTKAALKAIESANIKAKDIDLIIVATLTPDCFTPSTACIVQKNIGAVNAVCFDLSAACTGFIYALDTASQFIITGRYSNALVIGAETLSKILNWKDRSTCVLFGDGAGAAVIKTSDNNETISFYTASDGSKGDYLRSENVPVVNPFVKKSYALYDDNYIHMDGKEIFKFAVNAMGETIKKLLEQSGESIDNIKYIVPHQANLRIIDFTAKRLKIDSSKFFVNLNKFGNTSAASIAIALDDLVRSNMLKPKDKIMLVGFGGGLTYGGAIFQWN